MLDLDISVVFISLLLWVLVVVLNRLYFRPVGEIIRRREEKVVKDSQELESLTSNIEEKTQTIEKALADAKRESVHLKEELIKKGETVRDQVLDEAREKSKELLDLKTNELERQIRDAEKKLLADVGGFSKKIKDTIL